MKIGTMDELLVSSMTASIVVEDTGPVEVTCTVHTVGGVDLTLRDEGLRAAAAAAWTAIQPTRTAGTPADRAVLDAVLLAAATRLDIHPAASTGPVTVQHGRTQLTMAVVDDGPLWVGATRTRATVTIETSDGQPAFAQWVVEDDHARVLEQHDLDHPTGRVPVEDLWAWAQSAWQTTAAGWWVPAEPYQVHADVDQGCGSGTVHITCAVRPAHPDDTHPDAVRPGALAPMH